MYGGCALSMEQSEVPPKAAADLRVECASGLALRALLAAGSVGAVAPVASGFASSLVTPPPLWMLRPDGAMGRCGVVGPRAALWRCGARAAQDFTSA